MPSSYIGLEAIVERVHVGLAAGVNRSAERLVERIHDAEPIDTGALLTGTDVKAKAAPSATPQARIGTPGESLKDIVQHERRKGPNRRKYVERPLLSHAGRHARFVAAGVREALG